MFSKVSRSWLQLFKDFNKSNDIETQTDTFTILYSTLCYTSDTIFVVLAGWTVIQTYSKWKGGLSFVWGLDKYNKLSLYKIFIFRLNLQIMHVLSA